VAAFLHRNWALFRPPSTRDVDGFCCFDQIRDLEPFVLGSVVRKRIQQEGLAE
jgi:hypothetical protein